MKRWFQRNEDPPCISDLFDPAQKSPHDSTIVLAAFNQEAEDLGTGVVRERDVLKGRRLSCFIRISRPATEKGS
jgi:hypothetical protein